MDAELEFAIQNNTTGKQLFDQVAYSDRLLSASFKNILVFGNNIGKSYQNDDNNLKQLN